jgi:hypothetical protein
MPRTKNPVSDKQLAANRANAGQSTGPRSPEGKARSSQNSRKHGFAATAFPVVHLEDVDEVAHLRDDAIARYQPLDSQELFAVERIALAQQALLRVERLHSGLFTICLNQVVTADDRPMIGISPHLAAEGGQIVKQQKRSYLLAEGFHRTFNSVPTFGLFLRYQAQTERLYRRAVEEFERLRALRHELPDEPILKAEPEVKETACTSSQTNPPASQKRVPPAHPPEHDGPDGELAPPDDAIAPQPDASSGPPCLPDRKTPVPPTPGAGCTIVSSRGNCPESDVIAPDPG